MAFKKDDDEIPLPGDVAGIKGQPDDGKALSARLGRVADQTFEPRAGGATRGVFATAASRIQSDGDRAEAYRKTVRTLLESVCAELNAAQRDGLRVTFQVGIDGFGRYVVQSIDVVKPL